MTQEVDLGFNTETQAVPLSNILPSKLIDDKIKQTKKYKQILNTMRQIGLIEPIVVHQQKNGSYLMMDGHLRLAALQDIGASEANCLIATDDEAFTYNKRISRLSTIQEHYMIRQALKRGVSEERLSKTLGINVRRIKEKQQLLKGICKEVEDILKTRPNVGGTLNVLKKMKPIRQIEVVELMVTANNYSASYAKALLAATSDDQLVNPQGKRKVPGLTEDERARMVSENEKLHRAMQSIKQDYGENVLMLTVANGYLNRLLNNENVSAYLSEHHQGLHTQLFKLTETLAKEQGVA